jgi:periplasmic copper chaperone A
MSRSFALRLAAVVAIFACSISACSALEFIINPSTMAGNTGDEIHIAASHGTRVASRLLVPVQMTAATQSFNIGSLVIEEPWARATPSGAKTAGAYMKITNTGQQADRLIGGSLPGATKFEVHEMTTTNNVMKMRRLEHGLEIKPGQSVELKPGSNHVMFVGLSEGLKAGQTIKGTLNFEKAGTVEVEYRVAPMGAQSVSGHAHH